MDFAARVARDACSITDGDVQRLREVGLSDRHIFDIAVAAAARCFFSKTLDAVGALPDAEYAELDPGLREALTVGRPIEQPSP
jgi:alkylhydroperoxidase family enzyme